MVKTPKFLEILLHRSRSDLYVVAAARGIALPDGAGKGEIVERLAVELTRPESIEQALEELSRDERLAWNALMEAGGALNVRPFMGYFGRLPGAAIRTYRPVNPQPPRPPAEWSPGEALWYRGLIFADDSRFELVYVPDEILSVARVMLLIDHAELTPVTAPGELMSVCDLLGDIQVSLGLMKRQALKIVNGRGLSRRDLLTLNELLSLSQDWGEEAPNEEDAPYIGFLLAFLQTTRLAAIRNGLMAPTAAARSWLERPRREQLRLILRWYLGSYRDPAEFSLPDFFDLGGQMNERARRGFADALRDCPPGQWLTIASLIERMRTRQPRLLRSWLVGERSFAAWRADESEPPASATWAQVEGLFTRNLLRGAFRWMGAVAVDGHGQSFQLTSLGAFLLGMSEEWEDEPEPRPIIVQPNFDVLVPAEANLGLAFRLNDFADLLKRDRIATHVITPDSVRRALEAGHSADDIVDFLTEASGRAVPQNVAYSVREWEKRYGEVEIRTLTVLTTAGAGLLEEIRANAKTKIEVLAALGPASVAIAPEDVPGLIKRLRKAGFSPRADQTAAAAGGAPLVHLPESELAHLLAAARAVEESSAGSPLPPGLTARLARLLSFSSKADLEKQALRVKEGLRAGSRGSAPAAAGPGVRFPSGLNEATLRAAIQKGMDVTLEYTDDHAAEFIRERVTPCRLEGRSGSQYLVAIPAASDEERDYPLDHIRTALPTDARPGRTAA